MIENHGVLNDITARNLIEKIQVSLLSSLVSHEEISSGCVLAISEGTLGSSKFGSSQKYEGSTLQTYCQNLYSTNLGFTNAQKAMIQPQDFKTNYSGSGTYCSSTKQYLFPMCETGGAGEEENAFIQDTYLVWSKYQISEMYWVRNSGWSSGQNQVFYYYGDSSDNYPNYSYSSTFYVRPAMVLKI